MLKFIDQVEDLDDLLTRLHRGDELTEAGLNDILTKRLPEGLRLDYKSGKTMEARGPSKLGKPGDFGGKLRQHVSAMANAAGGVLLVGVDEPKKEDEDGRIVRDPSLPPYVDGIKSYDATKLYQVARDHLQKLQHSLFVPVRLHVVDHNEGLVLVVVVPRSDQLVTCLEEGQISHYIRLQDSTVHAPGYLVQDLVLGRSRRPSFTAKITDFEAVVKGDQNALKDDKKVLRFSLSITNTGLVWMDRIRVGVVGYTLDSQYQEATESIAERIDIRTRDREDGSVRVIPLEVTPPDRAEANGPFQEVFAEVRHQSIRGPLAYGRYWAGALFVCCYNQPPAWFQVVCFVDRNRKRSWLIPLRDKRAVVAVHRWQESEQPGPRWDWFETAVEEGVARFWFVGDSDDDDSTKYPHCTDSIRS